MGKTRRKKHHTQPIGHSEVVAAETAKVPRTLVIKRGHNAAVVTPLVQDLRRVLEPYTARDLKERRHNKLKDFLSVTGTLGITHLLMLSATEQARHLRVARAPRGPTLTFKIKEFSLMREVAAAQRHPRNPDNAYKSPPLVVLNNFGSDAHMKLALVTFQNLFPSMQVRSVKLATCQRVVLVDYDAEANIFRLRHYTISATPAGASRRVRKLLSKREIPDLGRLNDVAEFVNSALSDASDSEADDVRPEVELSQNFIGRGNHENIQSTVRLHEVGPRLDLELLKVEEGVCEGMVLHHANVIKTAEEMAAQEKAHQDKAELKRNRREQQEINVQRKADFKESKRRRLLPDEDAADDTRVHERGDAGFLV